ncbi:hypothetical protein BP00DRAFT_38157 [Aspergillus indologenus CBS 114.80]|uniref:Secreted peptide n=1 Tax=Aspergillus indologenus CBS 114.80 TaxID=1450541 RepID=A0A2V5HRF8_9EURO|nr:hypothetical protein BP00DRAFT_38157 [Aspergillus indologenus CBS 114.80]
MFFFFLFCFYHLPTSVFTSSVRRMIRYPVMYVCMPLFFFPLICFLFFQFSSPIPPSVLHRTAPALLCLKLHSSANHTLAINDALLCFAG